MKTWVAAAQREVREIQIYKEGRETLETERRRQKQTQQFVNPSIPNPFPLQGVEVQAVLVPQQQPRWVLRLFTRKPVTSTQNQLLSIAGSDSLPRRACSVTWSEQ